MNLKWRLMFLPWPLKLFTYLGTLLTLASIFSKSSPPVFFIFVVSGCWFAHYLLGPHPDLVRKDHPDLLRIQSLNKEKRWI